MVSARSTILAFSLPSATAVRRPEFVVAEPCDRSCPAFYEAITNKDTCITAARATGDQRCLDPNQTWEDAFDFEELAIRPAGCHYYGNLRGCGLRLNNNSAGRDQDCGNDPEHPSMDVHWTSLLCKLVPPFASVNDEVGSSEPCPFSPKCTNSLGECATCTRSPWYADDHMCVCGPATSDWMTEDQCTKCPGEELTTAPAGVTTTAPEMDMKYIIMKSCDNSPCPEGYEAITDEDTCIQAASMSAAHMACHSFDGAEQLWGDVFHSVEVADKPTGCYTYGACQYGCGLYLNTFAYGSNATCGDCYSTSLLCKRMGTEVLV